MPVRNVYFALVAAALILSASCATRNSGFADLERDWPWGMPRAEVLASLGLPGPLTGSVFEAGHELFGCEASLVYGFSEEDKLEMVMLLAESGKSRRHECGPERLASRARGHFAEYAVVAHDDPPVWHDGNLFWAVFRDGEGMEEIVALIVMPPATMAAMNPLPTGSALGL